MNLRLIMQCGDEQLMEDTMADTKLGWTYPTTIFMELTA